MNQPMKPANGQAPQTSLMQHVLTAWGLSDVVIRLKHEGGSHQGVLVGIEGMWLVQRDERGRFRCFNVAEIVSMEPCAITAAASMPVPQLGLPQ